MKSLWSATAELPRFPTLKGDISTDVLIIGGGIAGILCARQLTRDGVECLLVEAGRICGGITKNTTAKITSQHGLIYHKLIRQFGEEKARMYLEANEAALRQYRKLCSAMDCGFEARDNFVYSLHDRPLLEEELNALSRLHFGAELIETTPLPILTAGAVRFPHQAQFHPLRFIRAVADGLSIRENTRVLELGKGTAVTNHGTVRAQKIIVTTHFPMLNKHGSYFLKLYQHRSYCLSLKHASGLGGMYLDGSGKGLSFRTYGDLLILGGGSHRTGKTGGGWHDLEVFAREHYPTAQIGHRWATQDCMSLDGVPYIGPYSKNTQDLYVATGFNKWGMTSAMAAASILADQVQGRENPYAPVFSPSRSMLRKQLWVNGFEAAASLLTPTAKRCPHMGCALKWNPQEHSWDCPCHGSRFEENGKLIDNPANGDLKDSDVQS